MFKRSRLWVTLLCMALLLTALLPLTVQAEAVTPEQILSSAVHMSASSGARVIGYLENGKAITVLDETKSFYKIDCYDMNGYIAKSQVEKKNDGKYYVNCREKSADTRKTDPLSEEQADQLQQSVLELGKKYLGVRYVHGGMSPKGFDCCGFTSYIYSKNGYSLHRVDCDQLQDGFIVSKEEMQVGDLVFFRQGHCVTSHVGIYAGNGQVLHASRHGISLNDLSDPYYMRYYLCARRVVCKTNTGISRDAILQVTTAADYTKASVEYQRTQAAARRAYLRK